MADKPLAVQVGKPLKLLVDRPQTSNYLLWALYNDNPNYFVITTYTERVINS